MVNLTAAERVYEYWIDKASSAADLVLKIVFAVILFLVARKLILWLCGLIRKKMRRFHTAEAVVSFTVSMVKYSLNTLLVLTIIVQLGIVSEASIAAAIASAGVAVSLALQGGLSNFAGGVMILLLKPFKVGDYIIFPGEGQEGTVKKIEMYYTTINSIDNRTIMIPNANLTNHTIINVTAMDRRKLEIKVGISYESDIRKAKDILRRLVEVRVHLMQLRHDRQNDVGQAEGDVRYEQRRKAEDVVYLQQRTDEGKEQRQRNAGDDLGVRHGDVRDAHGQLAQLGTHGVYADRRRRTQNGRNDGSDDGDYHRV